MSGRRVAPIAILLGALLLGGIAIYLAMQRHGAPTTHDAASAGDARIDTPMILQQPLDTAAPPDAAFDAEPPIDARRQPPDARPHSRDAGAITMAVDAGVPGPVEHGLVDIKVKPGPYSNISIDGGNGMSPPLLNRDLPTGRHTIRFLDPKSGDVLDTQVIDLAKGQHLVVVQH